MLRKVLETKRYVWRNVVITVHYLSKYFTHKEGTKRSRANARETTPIRIIWQVCNIEFSKS